MITELDIDNLKQKIMTNQPAELYYVASMVELREGTIDEAHFKSVPYYKVMKIRITDISNAYFEYRNFINHPDQYAIEEEEEYYALNSKYIHQYTVPKTTEKTNYFNPRMPSIIYGYRRLDYNYKGELIGQDVSESPVKPIYTNSLQFAGQNNAAVMDLYNQNKLAWKYAPCNEVVDGIQYNYVTSDWYILKSSTIPRSEHILINTKQKTSYFTNLQEAFYFLEQCEA